MDRVINSVFGSLKAGENQRIQNSMNSSTAIAEGYERQKREHHLKSKRSWLQSNGTIKNLEHFFMLAMPDCSFSRMLKSMEEKLANVYICEFMKVEALSL